MSRVCAGLDTEIAAFREQALIRAEFPYVDLDATFCKARVGTHVVAQSPVMATGSWRPAPTRCW
ncbi:transposase [Gordonia malaquae]|uniref:transposase n=1 Tax=Gordonia malaquae TaxID=410332 RepID=UPI0030FECBBC